MELRIDSLELQMESSTELTEISYSSDISDPQLIATQNSQLRELNLQLTNDLNSLREQFDDAVNLFPKMKDMLQENSTLKQQILDSKAKIDDLNRRLEICMQSNNELAKNANTTKNANDASHNDEIIALHKRIEDIQANQKRDALQFKNQIQESDNANNKLQADNLMLQNQINKIITAAQNCYNQNFNSVQSFLTYLMTTTDINNQAAASSSPPSDNSKYEKRIKKLTARYDEEKKKRKNLELEILQLRQEAENDVTTKNEQLSQIEDLNRKHTNEIQKIQLEYQQAIESLKAQIVPQKKYKTSSTQVVDQEETNQVELLKKEKNDLIKKVKEGSRAINMLKEQISNLTTQMKNGDESHEKYQYKIKSIMDKTEKLEKELKASKKQNSSLELTIENQKMEIKAIKSQFHAARVSNDEAKNAFEAAVQDADNAKKALEIVQKLLDNQQKEICALTNDRDSLITIVQNQVNALNDCDRIIQILQKNQKSTSEKIQQIVHEEDKMFTWDFGNLPDGLISILTGISENEGMSMESRIKHVFSVISKWLANSEQVHQRECEQLGNELDATQHDLRKMMLSLQKLLDNDSQDIDQIIEAVGELQKHNINLQQKISQYEASNEPYLTQEKYEELTTTIEQLQNINQRLKSKSKTQKNQIHEIKSAFIACQNKTEEEMQMLRQSNEKTRSILASTQEELEEVSKHNKLLLAELSECKRSQVAEFNEAQLEFDELLSQQAAKFDELQEKAHKEISEKTSLISKLESQIDDLTSKSHKWEIIAKQAHEDIEQLTESLEQYKMEIERQTNTEKERLNKEVCSIEKQYKDVLEQMRIKAEEKSALMQKLTEALNHNEQKMKQMNLQISQLNFQIQKSEMKNKSQTEAMERSKKLADAQLRAKILALETKYSVLIEEQKHSWENEKRNIFSYLAQEFRTQFDASQSFNYQSFQNLINKIKQEILRYRKQENSIRKILRAKDNQTVEDVITDLVLSMHPKLKGIQDY